MSGNLSVVCQSVRAQFCIELSAAVYFLFHATPIRDSQACDAASVPIPVCDKFCRSSLDHFNLFQGSR